MKFVWVIIGCIALGLGISLCEYAVMMILVDFTVCSFEQSFFIVNSAVTGLLIAALVYVITFHI